jgi:hypothetical protein
VTSIVRKRDGNRASVWSFNLAQFANGCPLNGANERVAASSDKHANPVGRPY